MPKDQINPDDREFLRCVGIISAVARSAVMTVAGSDFEVTVIVRNPKVPNMITITGEDQPLSDLVFMGLVGEELLSKSITQEVKTSPFGPLTEPKPFELPKKH
jgi:hypothetical protein